MSTLVFDVETHSADLLYSMPSEEFVRLAGFKLNDEDVYLTTILDELIEALRQADWWIGHNIHDFDLRAVFGLSSNEPLEATDEGRVYDTWTHAVLVNPAPYVYTNRFGQRAKGDKPESMKKWFSLDEQAHQLGVPGKSNDLKILALKYGDPSLPKKDRIRDGFGKIPTDDKEYRDYLVHDVLAGEHVGKGLLKLGPLDEYAMREQRIDARKAVISSNGFRVDIAAAQARVDELAKRRDEVMAWLVEKYDFPTVGKSPWASTEGETAIMAALADYGITPERFPDWPKTPLWEKRAEKKADKLAKATELEKKALAWHEEIESGDLPDRSVIAREGWIERAFEEAAQIRSEPLPPAFGLSLGGQELIALTAGTEAESMGQALAELKGQRSLAQLALDSTFPDGFVHPEITMLQRSGRWSTTKPGLTVWTARGDNAVEKAYFLADNDEEDLIEFDYENADARAVAAMSGDTEFAKRFEPGQDGHTLNAIAAWGAEKVATDPAGYRYKAKAPGHGWGYRIGSGKLGILLGDEQEGRTFKKNMDKTYYVVVEWQDKASKEAARYGYVVNDWGRKMYVEKGREFTQGPALKGQSVTREIVCDAILNFPIPVLRAIKAQVHDAIVFSVPKEHVETWRVGIMQIMETTFSPPGGQTIEFPVKAGPPGSNWYEAGH